MESTVLSGVGVRAGKGRLRPRADFADTGPESQVNTQQETMFFGRMVMQPLKTLNDRKKGEWQLTYKVQESFSDIIPSKKGIGDNVGVISIVVWLFQKFKDCHTEHIEREPAITTAGCVHS